PQISDEPATGCAGPVEVEGGAGAVAVSHPLRAAVVSDERGAVPVLHQRRDGVPGAPTEDVPGGHTDGVVVVRPRRRVACDVVLTPGEHVRDRPGGEDDRRPPIQRPGTDPRMPVSVSVLQGAAYVALVGPAGAGVGRHQTLGA